MRSLVAGNWKMNGLAASLAELTSLKAALAAKAPVCEVLMCPPFTLLAQAAWTVKDAFALGGQDCSPKDGGAFTGDISAAMLKDAGASTVIVGHSERRQYHGERDGDVAAKVQAAWRAGLNAIICVGETESQRDAGEAHGICTSQLEAGVPAGATAENTAIAYEPVWAIGTGKTPTAADIVAMHGHIRSCLVRRLGEGARQMRILYGGSVKPDNAAEILNLPEVNGALVGGASLKCADFLGIIAAVKPA
ncbi:MAG: triose-phosphate isomerase [Alphaproteobacteria bacterium]|nr:triose-phosphate isomerase [Alphaproteobacteria bacterium]